MRQAVRALRKALDKKEAQTATALLPATFSIVDRAAKWGIIKDNTAARYKASIHKRLKGLTAAPATA